MNFCFLALALINTNSAGSTGLHLNETYDPRFPTDLSPEVSENESEVDHPINTLANIRKEMQTPAEPAVRQMQKFRKRLERIVGAAKSPVKSPQN